MNRSRPILLSVAALTFFGLTSPGAARAECPMIPVDYAAACGETTNLTSLKRLETAGSCVTLEVNSRSRWNASGLLLEQGVLYEIVVVPDATGETHWCDAQIRSTATGWKIPEDAAAARLASCEREGELVPFSDLQLDFLRLAKGLARHEESPLFTLIGVTEGLGRRRSFPIGDRKRFVPAIDGEFCSYANDTNLTYFNNSGSLRLEVWRVPEGVGGAE